MIYLFGTLTNPFGVTINLMYVFHKNGIEKSRTTRRYIERVCLLLDKKYGVLWPGIMASLYE